MTDLRQLFDDHIACISALREQIDDIDAIAEACIDALRQGGRVFWMGNGGSAADAQHMAAELVVRFECERAPLPSMAFTTDTSILTAIGNDYAYDEIFARQAQAHCRAGDVLIGISSSGTSTNVIKGFAAAKAQGCLCIGLTGRDGGQFPQLCDLCCIVPSPSTARIQEAHILIGHCLCRRIDDAWMSSDVS